MAHSADPPRPNLAVAHAWRDQGVLWFGHATELEDCVAVGKNFRAIDTLRTHTGYRLYRGEFHGKA
jgi:hypothetical protein